MNKLILKHINEFNNSIGLDKSKQVVVGVSGGVDSMVLLSVMYLSGYKVRAVHINHNTRKLENIIEEKLVKEFCCKNNIDLDVYQFKSKELKNFEMEARNFRYKIFKSYHSQIITAHHIDDSFEWHLMQKFKSSSKNQYGIPARNNNIFRPFMCLSKNQIYSIANKNNIPFLEDSSNDENNYERNYMRNIVIPLIAEQYPNYLKHYVNQMNNKVKEEGLHISSVKEKSIKSNELPLNASYSEIESIIKINSNKKRGKISNNLNSLIKAIENNKRNFSMDFSGSVTVRVTKKNIIIETKD